MFKKFLWLEWKSFVRASSFGNNMIMKIFMVIGALYFSAIFLSGGILAFYGLKKATNLDPLIVVSRFMIYYTFADLLIRLFFQKIPVINIRPLIILPIKRSTIINFAIGKTMVSFFNFIHALFFIPFCIVLIKEGYDPVKSVLWLLSIWALTYCVNLLNTLLTNKDNLFIGFVALVIILGGLQYYHWFDITTITQGFYYGLYNTYYLFIVPILLLAFLWTFTYKYFYKNLYLDTGLKGKHEVAKTENYTWLNQFGTMGTFLKNDIKMIRRNKRSKTAVLMSFAFLFYGLLFYTGGIEAYQSPAMQIFAAIFVSGGFMFTFGQFVPSWDSAYYPLMMSQNIPYRDYIASKWWLIVIGTVISLLLSVFYLYFGLNIYMYIVAGAIYNLGVNSHLVLVGGAFTKTPIDLASSKQAFGDKKAFNMKTFLLTIPKMILPMLLYCIGFYTIGSNAGLAFVAGAGILGFAFRNKMFTVIEKLYKTEKYKAISAYSQKN
ncbi:hypothetical protein GR160_15340 [Flavobacterium sp. Sd200]|uniref:DUF5687 family protein n=1 Tax=Flavobacterium sp. Sd200 TaxID=2692211 RepID=UPI001369E115|nr:DUF5687 family protein [Flavobacterium sp. Sd200]MXN92602.1 hypothetical protein [Flavobacterium sp. Sd200]